MLFEQVLIVCAKAWPGRSIAVDGTKIVSLDANRTEEKLRAEIGREGEESPAAAAEDAWFVTGVLMSCHRR